VDVVERGAELTFITKDSLSNMTLFDMFIGFSWVNYTKVIWICIHLSAI
jgi:hypothetical protein